MEIDVVFTWVNSSDPAWRILHQNASLRSEGKDLWHSSVNSGARYRNRGELVYSVAAVRRYCPWVRNIFIVSNCRLPERLEEYNVFPIRHEEIFPDENCLPCFNSRAIESCLHRIDGLSEKFIYFNDDVFVARPVGFEKFFDSSGRPKVFLTRHDIKYWGDDRRPVDYAAARAGELILRDFGVVPDKKLHHAPFPMLRSIMCEIEERYVDEIVTTRKSQFKSRGDLPVATTMQAYYGLSTGASVLGSMDCRYVDIGDPLGMLLLSPVSGIRRRKYEVFCLNEVNDMKFFSSLRDWLVSRFLEKYFGE